MLDIEKLLKSLNQKLDEQREEEAELNELKKAGVIEVLNNLSKKEITDSNSLAESFVGVGGYYAKIFQSLFGIATKNISSGSFVILDDDKARALSILSSPRHSEQWSIINTISSAKLNLYCSLVNEVSDRELNRKPSAVVGSPVVNSISNQEKKSLVNNFSKS